MLVAEKVSVSEFFSERANRKLKFRKRKKKINKKANFSFILYYDTLFKICQDFNFSFANLILSKVFSFPKISAMSNGGAEAFFPVKATLKGHKR